MRKQIATKAKSSRAARMLPMTAEAEPDSIATGLTPSRTSSISAAAITVASIELRPSSAQ